MNARRNGPNSVVLSIRILQEHHFSSKIVPCRKTRITNPNLPRSKLDLYNCLTLLANKSTICIAGTISQRISRHSHSRRSITSSYTSSLSDRPLASATVLVRPASAIVQP